MRLSYAHMGSQHNSSITLGTNTSIFWHLILHVYERVYFNVLLCQFLYLQNEVNDFYPNCYTKTKQDVPGH